VREPSGWAGAHACSGRALSLDSAERPTGTGDNDMQRIAAQKTAIAGTMR
jgi:hypothetical protein